MAHFAQLDENNIVINVIVVSNDDITNPETGQEDELLGIAFCKNLVGADTNWKQTSYNRNMRVHYASIGYFYDEELDVFIPPKPFESWVLNPETYFWESPVGHFPDLTEEQELAGFRYIWNEENKEWELLNLSSPTE